MNSFSSLDISISDYIDEFINNFDNKTILELPDVVLSEIVSYLDQNSILQLMLTCSRFIDVTRQQLYKKLVIVNEIKSLQNEICRNATIINVENFVSCLDIIRLGDPSIATYVKELICLANLSWGDSINDSWYLTASLLTAIEVLIWPRLPIVKFQIIPTLVRSNIRTLCVGVSTVNLQCDSLVLSFSNVENLIINLDEIENVDDIRLFTKLLVYGQVWVKVKRLTISGSMVNAISPNNTRKKLRKKVNNHGWIEILITLLKFGLPKLKLNSLCLDKLLINDIEILTRTIELSSLRELELSNILINDEIFLNKFAKNLEFLQILSLDVIFSNDIGKDWQIYNFLNKIPPLKLLHLNYDLTNPRFLITHQFSLQKLSITNDRLPIFINLLQKNLKLVNQYSKKSHHFNDLLRHFQNNVNCSVIIDDISSANINRLLHYNYHKTPIFNLYKYQLLNFFGPQLDQFESFPYLSEISFYNVKFKIE